MKVFKLAASAVATVALTAMFASQALAAPPGFDIVITADDLPAHGPLPPNATRIEVAQQFLAALTAHQVPEVYGFVNAIHIDQEPGTAKVLDMWRAAGYPLANHTYSHMNINTGGLTAFEADIEKGEPAISSRMTGQDWHYLRFPFLAAGTDPAVHAGIIDYLKTHGYRIADVNMSWNDWAYTDTYARCVAKGDQAAIDAMKAQYLQGAKDAVARAEATSQMVYGRQIPEILLIHEGAFTALMLPQVLDQFKAEGAHYITLAQALSDPAYADTDPNAGNGTVVDLAAKAKGVNIWGPDVPKVASTDNLDTLCR